MENLFHIMSHPCHDILTLEHLPSPPGTSKAASLSVLTLWSQRPHRRWRQRLRPKSPKQSPAGLRQSQRPVRGPVQRPKPKAMMSLRYVLWLGKSWSYRDLKTDPWVCKASVLFWHKCNRQLTRHGETSMVPKIDLCANAAWLVWIYSFPKTTWTDYYIYIYYSAGILQSNPPLAGASQMAAVATKDEAISEGASGWGFFKTGWFHGHMPGVVFRMCLLVLLN